ncbi:MAG TPA: amidohydrolase family protein [Streptosporangiaceae bacterium]|jgi:aminocarboxymuconate-semialdehyde decarboxylase
MTGPTAIDVHTHFVPPEVVADARRGAGFDGLRAERAGGAEWLVHRQGFRYPLHPAFSAVEARLTSMDERDIAHAVVSIAPPLFMYEADPDEAVGFCRRANDALAAYARDGGDRISAVATLPMRRPDAAARELRRAVGELGMRGAEIGPATEDVPLDDPVHRPVLETAADLGVPLILHPYYVGARPELADFYLTNLVGNPLATTVAAARLILSGTLDAVPALRLVLMHGGGYLPYQIGRLDHGNRVRPESRGCRHAPSAYLPRFWYDTVTHHPRALRFLVDQVGAGQVAYGTDFPFDMAAGPPGAQFAGADLTADERERIAAGTATALFGLPVRAG